MYLVDKFYEDHNAFKLFMLDVGLMGAMAEASAESITESCLLSMRKRFRLCSCNRAG